MPGFSFCGGDVFPRKNGQPALPVFRFPVVPKSPVPPLGSGGVRRCQARISFTTDPPSTISMGRAPGAMSSLSALMPS